ncbi:YciI family protein [Streptacidiphilus monticola]|uniref:YciI family protein n=1 Tax=Streptacidiphilus monticola TaxID=2161674 RepID=A0ABW1G415_9ACTN
MDFDRFTVALLQLRPDAPELDEAAAAALQDAHMNHLAELHESGVLLAAGPLLDTDSPFRGLSIFRVGPAEAQALAERDPGVLAGRYSVTVLPWMVPGGAVTFSPTRFPHSAAEAAGD